MQLVSGITALENQRLDNLSKGIADLKESLEFIQDKAEEKFNKINEKENCRNKLNTLQEAEKYKIFEGFSKEEVNISKKQRKNQKNGKISYLQYKPVIYQERNEVSYISFISF